MLARRIKEVSPILTVRRERGPTTEEIHTTLKLINPIIFAENFHGRSRNQWSSFGRPNVRTAAGYMFKQICKAIFILHCRKTPVTRRQIMEIANLTCQNYQEYERYLDRHWTSQIPREIRLRTAEQPLPSQEVGIEEIEFARIRAESNGANSIPSIMHAIEPINDETDALLSELVTRQQNRDSQESQPQGFTQEDFIPQPNRAQRRETERLTRQRIIVEQRIINNQIEAMRASTLRVNTTDIDHPFFPANNTSTPSGLPGSLTIANPNENISHETYPLTYNQQYVWGNEGTSNIRDPDMFN